MRTLSTVLTAVALAVTVGLATPVWAQDSQPAPKADATSFGSGVTDASKAISLDDAVAAVPAGKSKDVVVKGRITKVCRKKGCWFVLQGKDASHTVRITMKDYGFFVPTDCDGRDATVAGTLEVKTITEKMRKHLAEDEGKDPAAVKGDIQEYGLVATGVVLH